MNAIPIRLLAATLMVVVFVCGFLSGRLTAPRLDVAPLAEGAVELENERSVDQRVMRRYTEDLELTRDQLRILRPMFVATGQKMQSMPKNSEARLKELESFHAAMSPHLTERQRVKARSILDRAIRLKRGQDSTSER